MPESDYHTPTRKPRKKLIVIDLTREPERLTAYKLAAVRTIADDGHPMKFKDWLCMHLDAASGYGEDGDEDEDFVLVEDFDENEDPAR